MLISPNIQSHSLSLLAVVLLVVLGILLCARSLRYFLQTDNIRPLSIYGKVFGRKAQTVLYATVGLISLVVGVGLWTGPILI